MPFETVASRVREEPRRGPLWLQIYVRPHRGATRAPAQRAREAGFEAPVLTLVDAGRAALPAR